MTMSDREQRPTDKIKLAIDRSVKAMTLRPSVGLGTGVSRARIVRGLVAEFAEGPWKFTSDMPAGAGGESSAPTPGVFGRGALGSCIAMGYVMEAARAGITLDSVEVEVQADYDDGALFGTSANPPGYLDVRIAVTIESGAPEEKIRQLGRDVEAHSPYLDIFRRAQPCATTLTVRPPAGGR